MKEIFESVQPLDPVRGHNHDMERCNNGRIPFELTFDDVCPLCGVAIDMGKETTEMFHDIVEDDQRECNVVCVHLCPHCHKLFVSLHNMYDGNVAQYYRDISHQVFPYSQSDLIVSEELKQVSPKFEDLYLQAYKAKTYGLKDIYGMALRKAFEWLVKDYALYLFPEAEDLIAAKKLAGCIDAYIDNPRIKHLATSCRLIGNNETHWKNSNSPEDLELLEKVLDAVIYYIQTEIVVAKAIDYNGSHNKGQ